MSNSPSRRTGAPGARLRPLPRIDGTAEVVGAAAAHEHTFIAMPGTVESRSSRTWDGASGTPQGETVSAARRDGAALQNGGGSSVVRFHTSSSKNQDLAKTLQDRSTAFQAEHKRAPLLQDIEQDAEWKQLQARADSTEKSSVISPLGKDGTGSVMKSMEENFRLYAEDDKTSKELNNDVGTRLKSSAPRAYFLSREGLRKVVDPEFLRSELDCASTLLAC